MEQSEKANSKVEKNTEIKVVISTGKAKKTVSIPDVRGMSEDDAQKTLENLNLVVEAQAQNNDTVASGKVISTDPAAGTQLTEGSKVTMYVSLGIESDYRLLLQKSIVILLRQEWLFHKIQPVVK